MKISKLVKDYDFHSEDGKLQYRLVKGTLAQQREAFAMGGFSWLSASDTRAMIVDNPTEPFARNWYRTGTGVNYVNLEDASLKLVFSPMNRILKSGQKIFEMPIDKRNVTNMMK